MGALSASGNGSKTTLKHSLGYDMTKKGSRLQNSGTSLKGDVRYAMPGGFFLRYLPLQAIPDTETGFTCLKFAEENHVHNVILEPSSFFIRASQADRFFQRFSKSIDVAATGGTGAPFFQQPGAKVPTS